MVILETFGNISSLLDIILLIITAAGVFYGLKTKFVGEAKKASKELELIVESDRKRIDNLETKLKDIAVTERAVMINTKRLDTLELINSNTSSDIATLKERTRHL